MSLTVLKSIFQPPGLKPSSGPLGDEVTAGAKLEELSSILRMETMIDPTKRPNINMVPALAKLGLLGQAQDDSFYTAESSLVIEQPVEDKKGFAQSFTSISTVEPVGRSFTSNASMGLVGRSFASNSSFESLKLSYSAEAETRVGPETEPAYILTTSEQDLNPNDVLASIGLDDIPIPTKFTHASIGNTSCEKGEGRRRRKDRSLITLAQKAEERQHEIVSKTREEKVAENIRRKGKVTEKMAPRGRKKSRSLITLAQKAAQLSSNACSGDTSSEVAAAYEEICNACGGGVLPHFKFCQYCGASKCSAPENLDDDALQKA